MTSCTSTVKYMAHMDPRRQADDVDYDQDDWRLHLDGVGFGGHGERCYYTQNYRRSREGGNPYIPCHTLLRPFPLDL